mmetsp:Transcript_29208/g.58750  ORF Transcript_29208/g.58750 Transcript_29208/m.58750 type:complete len:82 (+) Transcript_29208:3612-3857(+)
MYYDSLYLFCLENYEDLLHSHSSLSHCLLFSNLKNHFPSQQYFWHAINFQSTVRRVVGEDKSPSSFRLSDSQYLGSFEVFK